MQSFGGRVRPLEKRGYDGASTAAVHRPRAWCVVILNFHQVLPIEDPHVGDIEALAAIRLASS